MNCYKHLQQLVRLCPPGSSKTQPNPAALPLAHPELSHAARILFKNSPRATATPPPPRTPPGALRLGRPCPGLGQRAARCCPRAPAHWDPPRSGREAGAAGRKERCGGEKGQTLKLPGCGLRARMLSVLPTSWQQQHGPRSSSPLR